MGTIINSIVLNLLECEITLYPTDSTGAPLLNAPIWIGVKAEDLKVQERWLKIRTTPSGRAYPKKHPLVAEYEIDIARIWILQLADLVGFQAEYGNYVLDVTWTEEETGDWHRRTFYGVTISNRSLESRDMEHGFGDGQMFDAEYFIPASGRGAPPQISSTLPYTVYWVDSVGRVLLYTYDSDSHVFTAAAPTTGHATIVYVDGELHIQFVGDAQPVLRTLIPSAPVAYRNSGNYRGTGIYSPGSDYGLIIRGGVFTDLPLPTKLPRLDFYYGNIRLASLAQDGLYDTQYIEATPTLATGLFGLYAGATLRATLAPGEIKATTFKVE